MLDLDFLNDFIKDVGEELALSGVATLTSVAVQEKNGKKSLAFGLNNVQVYVNLASASDSDARKKACAIAIYKTLYALVDATNACPFSEALQKAQAVVGQKVEYVRKERSYTDANSGDTKFVKDLVSLKCVQNSTDVGF